MWAATRVKRMDKGRCGTCGGEHDLSEMEPSYTYPDAYLAVPPEERILRTTVGSDECRLEDGPNSDPRFFLRVLLPMPVRGEPEAGHEEDEPHERGNDEEQPEPHGESRLARSRRGAKPRVPPGPRWSRDLT